MSRKSPKGKSPSKKNPHKSAPAAAITPAKKLALCAVLAAAAMILSYLELLIPFNIGAPGVKIGLANIAVLLALYYLDAKHAVYVNLVRIAVMALLFGSAVSFLYSLAGGLVSLCLMMLLKKPGVFSIPAVSMAGGVCHNIVQTAVAALLTKTPAIFSYMPVLFAAGIITGIFNGAVTVLILRKMK